MEAMAAMEDTMDAMDGDTMDATGKPITHKKVTVKFSAWVCIMILGACFTTHTSSALTKYQFEILNHNKTGLLIGSNK